MVKIQRTPKKIMVPLGYCDAVPPATAIWK